MAQQVLEAECMRTHNLITIGERAAMVAHDLCNLLTGIGGYVELVSMRLPQDSVARKEMSQVSKLVSQSIVLTRQLTTFGPGSVTHPALLDLNEFIRATAGTLRRLVGKDIAVNLVLDPDAGAIRGHQSRLEHILMNLATNARDAMPAGGTIRIETSKAFPDEYCGATQEERMRKQYASVTFADTGCGMDEDTLAQVFKLFFTTKGTGKGSGIGLATAYETVKRHGGYISAESKRGMGSTFRIYLPCAQRAGTFQKASLQLR